MRPGRTAGSPRATLAGRSTSQPHAATAGGPARASGTSRGEPGGPRGRATAERRAGGGERRPPLSPRSRGAGSAGAGRPRLALLVAHARPRLTFSHKRSRTLRQPLAQTDKRRHTTAGSSLRERRRAGRRARNTAAAVVKTSRSLTLTPPHLRAALEVAATPSDAGTQKGLAQPRCEAADRLTTWTNPVNRATRNYKTQNARWLL